MISIRRKLMAKMQSGGGRLPSAYREAEYIQSSGSQFINISDEYHQYEYSVVAAFTNTRTQYACLCGWFDDAYIATDIGQSASMAVHRINGRGTSKSASVTSADYLGQKLQFDCFKAYAKITDPVTGTVLAENNNYFELVDSPLWVFHCDSNKSYMIKRLVSARLYSFKAFLSGSLAVDLVPCYRKSDNTPGLYDLVSDTFFTNQGTGDFIVGPNV